MGHSANFGVFSFSKDRNTTGLIHTPWRCCVKKKATPGEGVARRRGMPGELVVVAVGDQAGVAKAGLNGLEDLIEGKVRIFGRGALAFVLRCVGV